MFFKQFTREIPKPIIGVLAGGSWDNLMGGRGRLVAPRD
jgi:hypothetical protein